MTLEVNTERRAVKEALRRGVRAEKWGLEGWPDRIVLLGVGAHFWWEFKKLEGRLRKAQLIIKEKLEEMGDRVYVPRTYDEAVEQLDWEIWLHRFGSPVAGVRRW